MPYVLPCPISLFASSMLAHWYATQTSGEASILLENSRLRAEWESSTMATGTSRTTSLLYIQE